MGAVWQMGGERLTFEGHLYLVPCVFIGYWQDFFNQNIGQQSETASHWADGP